MNTKLFTAAAILGALSSTAAIGAVNDGENSGTASSSGWVSAISGDLFYGFAQDELIKNSKLDDIDIAGLSVRYTGHLKTDSPIFPEFFGIASFGAGSDDYKEYYVGSKETNEYDCDLFSAQFAVGANIRFQPTEKFSLFAGVRVGLAYESIDLEYKENGWKKYDKTESEVGFLYGIGVGADFNITKHHGITVSVDYVGSTAEPDFDYIDGEKIKTEKQSYVMVSVGYKYTF